jgi:hypothetical protein
VGRPIVLAVPSLIVFASLAAAPGAIGQATKTDKERLVGKLDDRLDHSRRRC